MDPDRYNNLVAELENLAATDRRALRTRVLSLVGLGYGYVFAILLTVIGAAAAIAWMMVLARASGVAIKLVIPLVILAWVITKSLWVKTQPPLGHVLERGRAPLLEQRVEEIRAALDAPRANTVLLTSDFNASVTQIPRLGIFGWPKTYLMLGVPLMYGLEPRQLDAVLAHEFGHLSGSHPKMGLWVYRMGRTWQQLLSHLEEGRSWGSHLFASFVRWYVPRLQAYGFVMSRRDEYEADADAALITGAAAMGEALLALEIRGRVFGDRFWPDVLRRVESESTAPQPWSTLPAVLREDVSPADRIQWIQKALTRRALDDDTHPALGVRLAALGVVHTHSGEIDALARPLRVTAAEYYLGPLSSQLLAGFDAEWRAAAEEPWRQRHEEMRARRSRVDALIARDRAGPQLESEEVWELACTVADIDSDREALPYLRRTVAAMPDHAAARFMLGSALVAARDPAGVEHLQKAMSLTPAVVAPASEILRQYYAEQGDRDGVAAMQRVQHEHAELMRLVAAERADVTKRDSLIEADLSAQVRQDLRAMAEGDSRITTLWVARKVTQHLTEQPMTVVLVEPRWWRIGMRGRNDQELAHDVFGKIESGFSGHLLVIVLNGRMNWLARRIKKIAGATVYSR